MLTKRADRRTVVFISAYYLLLAYSWMSTSSSLAALALWSIPLCALSWIAAVITHNTLHCPIFKNKNWNRFFQVALSASYGFPVSEYVPGHNLSHHRYTQSTRDVMRTTKMKYGWNALNFALFVPKVAFDVTEANFRFASTMKKEFPAWYRQFLLEAAVVWGEKALLLVIDWKKTLFLVIVPHIWAVWGITAVNYLQHDGCDPNHRYNHSRNFVGKRFNWFTFNNGFHGIHHDHPNLHWSELPEVHAREVHGNIHPELEQASLLKYLWKTFVYPGKRVTFDGKPVVSTDTGKDEDWIQDFQQHTQYVFRSEVY